MEQARATFLTTYLNWAKPSLLALVVGVLTTIFTLIGAASNAVPVILKTLNLPACCTSDVYGGTQTDFKKEGEVWREYAPEAVAYLYEFTEVRRTRDEIILRNLDRMSMAVRKPISKRRARSGVNTHLRPSPICTNSRKSGGRETKSYCAI